MSGTRKLASFGILQNRTLVIDMAANVPGTVMPSSGVLRFRNGSTACWANVAGNGQLCAATDSRDRFSFDSGVSTPSYSTTTHCENFWGQCGSASAGSVGLSTGARSVLVSTTAVTAQSQIFIQEDASLGSSLGVACDQNPGRTYIVVNRTPG